MEGQDQSTVAALPAATVRTAARERSSWAHRVHRRLRQYHLRRRRRRHHHHYQDSAQIRAYMRVMETVRSAGVQTTMPTFSPRVVHLSPVDPLSMASSLPP